MNNSVASTSNGFPKDLTAATGTDAELQAFVARLLTIFEDPDRYDPDRDNLDKHVAFGYGVHFCIGVPLARLETNWRSTLFSTGWNGSNSSLAPPSASRRAAW